MLRNKSHEINMECRNDFSVHTKLVASILARARHALIDIVITKSMWPYFFMMMSISSDTDSTRGFETLSLRKLLNFFILCHTKNVYCHFYVLYQSEETVQHGKTGNIIQLNTNV